jgi:hypothetical protein
MIGQVGSNSNQRAAKFGDIPDLWWVLRLAHRDDLEHPAVSGPVVLGGINVPIRILVPAERRTSII